MPARRQSVSVLEAGEKTLAAHQPQSPLAMTGGGRRTSGQNSPETSRPSSKLPFPVRRLSCGNSQDGFTALVQQTHTLSHSATPTFQPPRGEFQQSPLVPKLFTFCCRTVSRRPRRQPSLRTLCSTRNPTSKPAVRTALNVHGSNNRAWVPVERYRFTISDGNSFEHVGEAVYASPLAAEAHAIQVARELSEDGDTWHGGWISVTDSRGHEIALLPIGIERTLTKSEAARRRSQQAIRKPKTLIQRLDEARRTRRPPDCGD
jgi:hypothetical protein